MKSLGRYDVVKKIGEGGFGEVYEGFDPHLKRRVAIKTCNSSSKSHLERFEQEAAIAGTLHHRNLTATYDFSQADELAYLVQEYLEGEDLDQKIARRDDISVGTKLLYLIQLARGLRHVHSAGIVHRDVKPSNVRVLPTGQVKLMDFGIAGSLDETQQPTLAGETMGTAAYLAPEQIRGEPVDTRADIYSFGVTAYELLCFERPFPGDDAREVLNAVMEGSPPSVEKHWPACPPALSALVDRCMQKDRDQRYPDFGAVLEDFDRILGDDSGRYSTSGLTEQDEEAEATVVLTADSALLRSQQHGSVSDPDRTQVLEQPTVLMDPELARQGLAETGARRSPNPSRKSNAQGRTAQVSPAPVPEAPGLSLITFILGLALMGIVGAAAATWYFSRDQAQAEKIAESPLDPESTDALQDSVQPATATPSTDLATASSAEQQSTAPKPTGTLILEPGWNRNLEARVNGRVVTLDQRRSIKLPAGRHSVVFRLADDPNTGWNESQSERQTVSIVAAEQTVLTPGLQSPGAVTIRAALGAPQAYIRVDGEPLGWAPINERTLPPGNYEITASATATEAAAANVFSLRVNSGEETVITFNIDSETPPASTVKAWTAS